MMFIPFDDSRQPIFPLNNETVNGINTSTFDAYRQGVEITSSKYLFASTQPKMWSGNITHKIDLITYGTAISYTEFDKRNLGVTFSELQKFNPVVYLQLGDEYPLPILLNQGSMDTVEAILEPLTIPDHIPYTNEGTYKSHGIYAELGDGNNLDTIWRVSSRLEQFVEYKAPREIRPFLDLGSPQGLGVVIDVPGFTSEIITEIHPFDDKAIDQIVDGMSIESSFKNTIQASLKIGLKNDIRPNGTKSMPAGYTHYGKNIGQYGTDSIAFQGWLLGSG